MNMGLYVVPKRRGATLNITDLDEVLNYTGAVVRIEVKIVVVKFGGRTGVTIIGRIND